MKKTAKNRVKSKEAKAMGRPRLADRDNLKTRKLDMIRVSPPELEQIEASAASDGTSLQNYVRSRLGLAPTNYRATSQ